MRRFAAACTLAGALLGGCAATTETDSRRDIAEELTDSNIVAILYAIHSAEIRIAEVAKQRARNPSVRAIAETILAEHYAANARQSELLQRLMITPEETPTSREIAAWGARIHQVLSSTGDADVDERYLDAEMDSHNRITRLIGFDLLPGVKDQALRRELEGLRPAVARHFSTVTDVRNRIRLAATTDDLKS